MKYKFVKQVYNVDELNEIIDKHIEHHDTYIKKYLKFLAVLGVEPNFEEDEELCSHASAITALKMLRMELNGEKEW